MVIGKGQHHNGRGNGASDRSYVNASVSVDPSDRRVRSVNKHEAGIIGAALMFYLRATTSARSYKKPDSIQNNAIIS